MNNRFFLWVVSVFLALLLIAGGFACGFLVSRHDSIPLARPLSPVKAKPSLDLVQEVINLVKHSYVNDVSTNKLIIGAVKGVIKALDDPYSHYFTPPDYNFFQEETSGRFFGVGIELGMKDSKLTVVGTIEGTPAYKAGIKSNDVIIKVDDKSTTGMSIHQAVTLIRGEKDTQVALAITREGISKPLVFKMMRAEIKLPNVKSKMLDDEIGYVRLHSFTESCGAEVKKAVNDLKDQGAKGMILDLRNNPGGLLNEAVDVSGVFLDSAVIVSIKKRSGKTEEYRSNSGADGDIPLVILVNHGSASASEIVAGAIKDHKRGVLVGEKTFGKGSVQSMLQLSNGGGMVLTTAVYMTPNGTVIHKKGIKPDAEVKTPKEMTAEKDPQLDKASEIINDLIKGRDWKKKAA